MHVGEQTFGGTSSEKSTLGLGTNQLCCGSVQSEYLSHSKSEVTNAFRYEFNGREIKNLLRIALAVSKYEKIELSESLIRRVRVISEEHLLKDGVGIIA